DNQSYTIQGLDSLNRTFAHVPLRELVKKFIQTFSPGANMSIKENFKIPKQNDETECGVALCLAAYLINSGEEQVLEKYADYECDYSSFRLFLAKKLLIWNQEQNKKK